MTSSVKRTSRRLDMLKKMLSPPQAARKKEKQNRPRGYMARKAGAAAFWVLFSFMFLIVAVTLFSKTEKTTAPKATTVEHLENPAVKPEAVQFAESFTAHYFNWGNSEEEKKQREEKLSAFLAEGLDPQAGLGMDKVTWNSTYKGSTLKKVEDLGNNKSLIVFYVTTIFSRETIGDELETKPVSKYFVVPVAYDGTSYGIYELPKFTHLDEKTTVQADYQNGLQKASSSPETTAVRRFLDTFFKSYTEDSTDKLAYILDDGTHIAGLNKSMEFVKVASADIYEGQKKGEYIVQSEVIMQDPESKMQFHTDYELAVKKDGERFVVSAMNESEGDKQ
ncbi:conjugal transfer protein [Domibacillus indicus]|uniref:conjugal transfer protein n=1 Tax=Domibacillus indicus TaxID=1437523 RepID=UPI00203E84D8|nr:conjugal transfer protein [Domibacillus indicus]MCM3791271.1 conjugal transfer protein [Domibacillus indicus]